MEEKLALIVKTVLKRKNNEVEPNGPGLKMYYKSVVIKAIHY